MTFSEPKSRGWLVTLAAASGVVAYVLCLYLPLHKATGRKRAELHDKRQFVQAAMLQTASLPQLEQHLDRARKHVEAWRQVSPRDPHLVDLLGRIAVLADRTNIRIQKLTPLEVKSMAAIRQHPLQLQLHGTFAELVEFIGEIEDLPESIWINELELKPSSQNGANVECELSLTVFADNRKISG